jgi:hypothetical protein
MSSPSNVDQSPTGVQPASGETEPFRMLTPEGEPLPAFECDLSDEALVEAFRWMLF